MNTICVGFMMVAGLIAQDGPSKNYSGVAQIVFVEPLAQMSNDELTDALQMLRERTETLQQELESTSDYVSNGSNNKNIANNEESGPRLDSSDQSKLDEIVENIRLLKQIFAEKEKRRLVEMARLKRQQKTEMVLPINGQKNTPSPNQGSGVKQNIPDPMLDNNDVRIPRQVVKGIVDPFELGNSLFMAGNIDEAIKFYQLVPVQEISAFERRWLELMLASCYRVQGKYSEAEASYRVVAGDGGGVNTSMTAKSWLSYISSKKNIDTVSEQFTSKANAVLEQGNLVLKEFEDGSGN